MPRSLRFAASAPAAVEQASRELGRRLRLARVRRRLSQRDLASRAGISCDDACGRKRESPDRSRRLSRHHLAARPRARARQALGPGQRHRGQAARALTHPTARTRKERIVPRRFLAIDLTSIYRQPGSLDVVTGAFFEQHERAGVLAGIFVHSPSDPARPDAVPLELFEPPAARGSIRGVEALKRWILISRLPIPLSSRISARLGCRCPGAPAANPCRLRFLHPSSATAVHRCLRGLAAPRIPAPVAAVTASADRRCVNASSPCDFRPPSLRERAVLRPYPSRGSHHFID